MFQALGGVVGLAPQISVRRRGDLAEDHLRQRVESTRAEKQLQREAAKAPGVDWKGGWKEVGCLVLFGASRGSRNRSRSMEWLLNDRKAIKYMYTLCIYSAICTFMFMKNVYNVLMFRNIFARSVPCV